MMHTAKVMTILFASDAPTRTVPCVEMTAIGSLGIERVKVAGRQRESMRDKVDAVLSSGIILVASMTATCST
jgi:hypothetical protein